MSLALHAGSPRHLALQVRPSRDVRGRLTLLALGFAAWVSVTSPVVGDDTWTANCMHLRPASPHLGLVTDFHTNVITIYVDESARQARAPSQDQITRGMNHWNSKCQAEEVPHDAIPRFELNYTGTRPEAQKPGADVNYDDPRAVAWRITILVRFEPLEPMPNHAWADYEYERGIITFYGRCPITGTLLLKVPAELQVPMPRLGRWRIGR